MKPIIFTDTFNVFEKYKPVPASKLIPEWYKELQSYQNNTKTLDLQTNQRSSTIKKCIPVFDAITSGYLILSPCDVYVSTVDGAPYFQWSNYDFIDFHSVVQAPTHPKSDGFSYPKFTNPWAIKTPSGYSCLFTAPKHRNNVFTILDGIVDTDNYDAPVNFPFVLNDPKWEGIIPAGTPIAQVIPFKRDAFKMEFKNNDVSKTFIKLRSKFFDSYKTQFWQRKEYK
jgi:hypothetical protein